MREISGTKNNQTFNFKGSKATRVFRAEQPEKKTGNKKKKVIYYPQKTKAIW